MPTGSHGAFRDYQVDAVSLEFSPTFHVKNENAKSLFLLRGGRYVSYCVSILLFKATFLLEHGHRLLIFDL